MTDRRANTLLLMLMAIIILLMIAIAGLFLRMNQLQGQVLAALSSESVGVPAQDVGLPSGTAAPDFTSPDLTGKSVSPKDFAGKPVLLAFSSTTCPACQKTYPHLKAFSEARRDIQVMMISRGTADENRQLAAAQGFSFPVLAWDDAVAQRYHAPGTPFFVVLDEQGVITASGFANTQVELDRLVADGLGEGR